MVTSMFDSLVWSFFLPGLSLVNSMPMVSAPQLTLVCACVILPWLSPSTARFWKISSALVFIVVFWCMSTGASPSAHGWHAWLIMISVGAVSLIMIGGGGLCVPLPCCSIVQCWGCGSTRSSCPWSCPTCFQSHVPAAMLACDEVLSSQRHSGSNISMSWVLLHTGIESSLLHIDNFDVGFSGISPVFFVCGPGMKKGVKDVCQRMGVFAFSVSPKQVGIAAASAAAYGFYFMFSIVCQVACRAAAAWRAGAFVYIFCLEGVFVFVCAFGQIASLVAAAASGNVFSQVASLAAAAWSTGALVYTFCVEGVFVFICVFLEWFLASCGWFLAFVGHVLGLRIKNLCCVSLTHHSCHGGGACPLIGAEQNDCVTAAAVDALRLVCSLSVAAGASEDLLSSVDSGVHDCEFDREDRPNTPGCLSAGSGDWASGRVDVRTAVFLLLSPMSRSSDQQQHQ